MFKRGLPLDSRWRNFEKREWTVFLLFLGYLPGVFALSYPLDRLFGSAVPFALVVAVAWMGAFGAAVFWHGNFPCPRCREPFFRRSWWYQRGLAKRCVHCGLPLWAEPQ
jgi:hypothetical protein